VNGEAPRAHERTVLFGEEVPPDLRGAVPVEDERALRRAKRLGWRRAGFLERMEREELLVGSGRRVDFPDAHGCGP
jgi:hypothetical protein